MSECGEAEKLTPHGRVRLDGRGYRPEHAPGAAVVEEEALLGQVLVEAVRGGPDATVLLQPAAGARVQMLAQ